MHNKLKDFFVDKIGVTQDAPADPSLVANVVDPI
jgi:hypothetical protein